MKRKVARSTFIIMALLLSATGPTLVSLATANFVVYLPYITINSDGSVEPETAFIVKTGNTYTLTANLPQEYAVKIQCSNIIFDGAGHIINGTVSSDGLGYANKGLSLVDVTNVTVKNLEVSGFMSCDFVISNCYSCSFIRVKSEFDLQQSENINISECTLGIYIRNSESIMITKSNISLGIESSSATFFENNFVNAPTRVLYATCLWDNSSVGNYWSDYLIRYPDASEIGNTGIGDTPYIIDADNVDYYPLMAPVDNTAPTIEILSPAPEVYNASSILLSFTVDDHAPLIVYSLDGKENITVTGNITLTGLANGVHDLTIYVKDEAGNVGASEIICFSVDVPFPTALVAAASGVAVAVIGVALLVYFRKRNHRAEGAVKKS